MAEDGLRILIAEDESLIRLGLKRVLMEMGHQVVAAVADGGAAVEMARRLRPDLAILDVRMPRLDGLKAAEVMVAERPLPVILLTAYSDQATITRARQAAVLAYLVKPIREDNLSAAIELALARFEAQQALAGERESLEEALETRELVGRAKLALMEREGLTETEAFLRIHQESRRRRLPMREVARALLERSAT